MKSVLITGTNRGIGLGLVKTLLASPIAPKYLIATCRKPAEAEELKELEKCNDNLHILQYDACDFDGLPKFQEAVARLVGPEGLNVLVNSAGISGKALKIGYLKPQAMIDTFTVNTVAPVMLTKELLPLLRLAAEKYSDLPLGPQRALVVNISTIMASIAGNDVGGYYPYRASKSGLNACTKSLSVDLKGYGILTTCLHPGWVKTSMGGPKAPMSVEDSTRQILETISKVTVADNGRFLNLDGKELPW